MRLGARGRRMIAGALALAATSTACGGGDTAGDEAGDDRSPARPPDPTSEPFAVDALPDGYLPVVAGTGSREQDWGQDSVGTDEPFTVLAPPGQDTTGPDIVIVSVTGYDGYQGGFRQASAAVHQGSVRAEAFDLDGARALYTPGDPDGTGEWADLVVDRGDDLAVRVRSRRGGRDELAEVARRVRPAPDHARPPEVPSPPDGLRVLGSAHVDFDLAWPADVGFTGGPPPGPCRPTAPPGGSARHRGRPGPRTCPSLLRRSCTTARAPRNPPLPCSS